MKSRRDAPKLMAALVLWLAMPLAAQEPIGSPIGSPVGLPIEGEAAEEFLRSARVIGRETLSLGVTRSLRVTLTDGELTADAIWKTIDEYEPVRKFDDGSYEVGFHDSYKNEIAAYELDKLLELGMVPPTVERRIRGDRGSMQLWVPGATMEFDRLESGGSVADPLWRNRQIYSMRLFHNLTYDTDLANARNILNDPEGRIYVIDNSRSFRTRQELISEADLTRFSSELLERLRELDRDRIRKKLGRWLSKRQIEGLMARRDLILELAEKCVSERGEDATLFR
jgi:hypothetical protein